MRITIPGTLDRVAETRRHARAALSSSSLADDAALIVSELVANAVLHTASGEYGGRVIVEVIPWQGHVLLAVTDEGPGARPCAPDDDDEHGRGLMIVSALAWWGERRICACHQTWAVLREGATT